MPQIEIADLQDFLIESLHDLSGASLTVLLISDFLSLTHFALVTK
jgi:hypothetical protein